MDGRRQPTCLNMKRGAVCNSRLNECESPLTKLVSASLKLERCPVKEGERAEGVYVCVCVGGGLLGWSLRVSKPGGTEWMGVGEPRRRRMEGGEKEGRRGHWGGLTACEYGLTSWVRLQVSSTGLEKTKIKPRNVNLFSIVNAEKRLIKSAYIHIKWDWNKTNAQVQV